MSRAALVLAALVALFVVPAEAQDPIRTWDYGFTLNPDDRPSTQNWRPTALPAELTRLADVREGYFWLRTTIDLPADRQALVLSSALILDGIWLDDAVLMAGTADRNGSAAGVFAAEAFPLPERIGKATLVLRLAHRGRSWVRGMPAVVPLARLPRELLLRNMLPVHLQGAAALALLFTFIPCLVLYRHSRSPRLLYLVGATVTASLQAGAPGLLSPFLPLSMGFAVENAASMATLALLVLFVSHDSARMIVGVIGAAALLVFGLVSSAVQSLTGLQSQLGVQEVPLALALVLVAYQTVRAVRETHRPLVPFVLLLGLLLTDLFLTAGAHFLVRLGLLPAGFASLGMSLFVLYVFLSEIAALRALNSRTVQELTDRVRTGREIIQKLREGKVRLESRNVEMTRNASRLLENAQRQALTIGQIMVSIAEVGTAESKVTVKERQIHSQTVDTEKMITDFDLQMRSTLQGLEDLARKSETIKRAVAQIIEIADKTNMLSLNASIEATKAGAAGMGFGVVAQEIRKLADTTRSVSDHVNSVIGETNKGVANGVRMVSALGRGFGEIMTRSAAIRRMIEENSRALDEVARSHREIEDGLAGVDLTISSILEVSRDLREMTDRVASTFSWFGEIFDLSGEKEAGETGAPLGSESSTTPPATPNDGIEDLEPVEGPATLR